jgi:hypothetical protein
LCWMSLLGCVGVVVNNLWEILFLTHRAHFLCRALEIESRPYNASLIRIHRMGFTSSGSNGSARDATIRQDFEQETLSIEQRFDQAKDTLRTTDNSAGQGLQTILARDRTLDATNRTRNRTHKATAVHRGRVHASGRADSTLGSMDGTAPCAPGTIDLIVWLRSQTSAPKIGGPLAGRELRSLIRRNRS